MTALAQFFAEYPLLKQAARRYGRRFRSECDDIEQEAAMYLWRDLARGKRPHLRVNYVRNAIAMIFGVAGVSRRQVREQSQSLESAAGKAMVPTWCERKDPKYPPKKSRCS